MLCQEENGVTGGIRTRVKTVLQTVAYPLCHRNMVGDVGFEPTTSPPQMERTKPGCANPRGTGGGIRTPSSCELVLETSVPLLLYRTGKKAPKQTNA